MAFKLKQNKIVWLASFPKSGNTWFRAFLTALLHNGKIEINSMVTDGIFSDRYLFDEISELDSRDLSDKEVKLMIADVYRYLAGYKEMQHIIKVHDAFETDDDGRNIIPEDATCCALYFLRNPLDIAGSLANHSNCSIGDAVNMLNDPSFCLAKQPGNHNRNSQFRQNIYDWSSHVKSWTLKPSFPVKVIRYEDMLTNTFEIFSQAVAFMGWEATPEQIRNAIEASAFERLSSQEAEKGFFEKNRKSKVFFRTGKMGNWKQELTQQQIDEEIMNQYNYLSDMYL